MLDLEKLRDIKSIETLVSLLQTRIGSPLSVASLARDLQRDPKTIQHWTNVLDNLFVTFRVLPYSRNIARSILKAPKVYFYDLTRMEGDEGIKFENLVALALKKEVEFITDSLGIDSELFTLRLKDDIEVDFLVLRKGLSPVLIEVKLSDGIPSKTFLKFRKYFPKGIQIQLVKNLKREITTEDGIEVRSALPWLTQFDLSKEKITS